MNRANVIKGENFNIKNYSNNDLYNERDDNFSLNSNINKKNLNEKIKLLENNDNNDFQSLKNNRNKNQSLDKLINKVSPLTTNMWEDATHKKIKNLEMTNDDLDEMFVIFNDNKKTNQNI